MDVARGRRQFCFFKNAALGDRNASDEICVRSRRSAGAAGRAEHNLVLTPRLPAAVAIFDVIVGRDPADPVTAASQGKRADSYLRFLDKDGARGARLGVVHQLFTSEDADPGAMARIGPQRKWFSPPRARGRCPFGEGTFASTHGNRQDAPKLDISVKAVVLPLSTRRGIDTVLFVITGVPLMLRLIAGAFLGCNNGRRLPFQDGVFPLNVFKSWL
jgi:hypothetical protein